jgi:hypothetical protein
MLATAGKLKIKGALAIVNMPQEHHRQAKAAGTLVIVVVLTMEGMPATAEITNTSQEKAKAAGTLVTALQISLDLCIPEKELAKARSQISFLYFQSHS